ncbi:hypothetical protein NTGM5_70028 [Candidatus Nitrotoga sp. M5]|nr:hypothetical protein NTGM5_70028 [Candidatus Nitrotoga sp. M5]
MLVSVFPAELLLAFSEEMSAAVGLLSSVALIMAYPFFTDLWTEY